MGIGDKCSQVGKILDIGLEEIWIILIRSSEESYQQNMLVILDTFTVIRKIWGLTGRTKSATVMI